MRFVAVQQPGKGAPSYENTSNRLQLDLCLAPLYADRQMSSNCARHFGFLDHDPHNVPPTPQK